MNFGINLFWVGLATGAVILASVLKVLSLRHEQITASVLREMKAYFKATGVDVNVLCHDLGQNHYVALIETAPLKKFRFSYIIEQSLNRHLMHSIGRTLERVYWRFVIPPIENGAELTENRLTKGVDTPEEQVPRKVVPTEIKREAARAPRNVVPEDDAPDNTLRNDAVAVEMTAVTDTGTYRVDEISWESFQTAIAPAKQQHKVREVTQLKNTSQEQKTPILAKTKQDDTEIIAVSLMEAEAKARADADIKASARAHRD